MRDRILPLLLTVLFAWPFQAAAQNRGWTEGTISIEIVPAAGRSFLSIPWRNFVKDGTKIVKRYLEARKGEGYGIVIRNNTAGRIGVVIAVDGRNIVSGKRSELRNDEAMYLLDAYASCEYGGWRTSSDEVHRFYFTDVQDSYAERTFNDSSAMGVIAAAVYREKEVPRPVYDIFNRLDKTAAPSERKARRYESGDAAEGAAGTGFGGGEYSPSRTVEFSPENRAVQKIFFKYEWRQTLIKLGLIQPPSLPPWNRLWDETEYAPFPPGERTRGR